MPLDRFSTKEVLANHRENSSARTSPLWRKTPTVFRPQIQPKFAIQPDTTFFAMGSCFARNLERAFHSAGLVSPTIDKFNALTLNEGYNKISFKTDVMPDEPPDGVVNKYNVPSMAQSMAAVALGTPDASSLYQAPDKKFWNGDIHLKTTLPHEVATSLVRHIFDDTLRIVNAEVVFLTLGLIEAWFDTKRSVYLNEKPPGRLALDPRFECHTLSHDDCKRALFSLVQTVQDLNPNCHTILTVSPVVLATTMSKDDVRIRNTLSKSVLRSVCEETVRQFRKVEYFPSFEMATLSDQQTAYYDDGIHVRQSFVDTIIHQFLSTYAVPELNNRFELSSLALSASLETGDSSIGLYHYDKFADRILASENLEDCILLKRYAAMIGDKALDKKLFSKVQKLAGSIGFARIYGGQ